jgi:hypothetical protein
MARKRNDISEEDLKVLKKDLLLNCGHTILNATDCIKLSDNIYKTTDKYISDSTLKRFLGFNNIKKHI